VLLIILVLLLLHGVCWRRLVSRSRDSYRISRTRPEDDEHDSQYRRCNLHPPSHPGSIALHSISNDAVSSIYRRHFLGIHRPPLYPLLERFLCGLMHPHLPQQRASQSGSSHARPRRLVLGSKSPVSSRSQQRRRGRRASSATSRHLARFGLLDSQDNKSSTRFVTTQGAGHLGSLTARHLPYG
ncbi:hypothetical protein B0H13DRAFT_2520524, partial [Mycena leptocephala]